MPQYRDNLNVLRRAFPQPVSDQEHDAWFVFSVLRALDRVDAMKSQRPILGEPQQIDFSKATEASVPDDMSTVELVSRNLVDHLAGMFIWGHPRSQVNVINPPCIPGILGTLLPAIYNPNLCSEEASRGVALAEAEVISMTARLMGYDPNSSGGIFTFGGTGTLLYAIRLGIEKAVPGAMQNGILGNMPVVVCSDQAHYANKTAASWLGLGANSVVKIPTAPNNEIRTCLLESELRRLLQEGRRIACIVATMGTTDAFGIDHLEKIRELRDELVHEFSLDYVPHLHADAVIGWAWSVFRDYDFVLNQLQFPDRTLRALAGANRRIRQLHQADSIGVDYHKTGFAPYVSSAFFVEDARDLKMLTRDQSTTPYLFQSGDYNPGKFTLETSRSGCGPMSALGALQLLGKSGLRTLLGHLVTMAETLRNRLTAQSAISVMNPENFGPVTLFRVYPDGVDTFEMPKLEQTDARYAAQLHRFNDYNRQVFQAMHAEALRGDGVVISMTDRFRETDYGQPVVALKSYIMSPFSDEHYVQAVVDSVERARKQVAGVFK
ncbi:MAG: pyridoxal-dependent decarboxylase [Planctomycetales bacterium]|jgi:glutamate/tyrosine decarboxylase-like PLP-dependent enzyme|nr:pyridoxal-dependent decarboxylase [Planctomycetales bacterium]